MASTMFQLKIDPPSLMVWPWQSFWRFLVKADIQENGATLFKIYPTHFIRHEAADKKNALKLRRLAWISCHKWVLSYFTTSCSGTLHHTTMLFNREITLEANSIKFCLVTYIFLKLFSKVTLLVTTFESLMKI